MNSLANVLCTSLLITKRGSRGLDAGKESLDVSVPLCKLNHPTSTAAAPVLYAYILQAF